VGGGMLSEGSQRERERERERDANEIIMIITIRHPSLIPHTSLAKTPWITLKTSLPIYLFYANVSPFSTTTSEHRITSFN